MNPFHPFHPALGARFLDRQAEQQTILNRIGNGASTAIVGNPHVGKTSLIKRLADPAALQAAGLDPAQHAVVQVTFELILSHHTQDDFWRQIGKRAVASQPALAAPLQPLLAEAALDLNVLNEAFEAIGQSGGRVVVLIDEFDKFLDLPNFAARDFVDPLRAMAMVSTGLCLITASRLSVAELQEQIVGRKLTSFGSPLNFLHPICLNVFDEATIDAWLTPHLPPEAIAEVRLLAGAHPLLLHLAGQLLWDEKANSGAAPHWDSRRDAFVAAADAHFRDVWRYLSDRAQLALVLLVLRDLEGQLGGQSFNVEKAGQTLTWLTAELKDLADRAVLEKDAQGRWTIGSAGFRVWLVEHKIAAAFGDTPDVKQWLRDKQFKFFNLVTNEEIAALQKVLKAIPADLIDLAKKALLPKALQ